MIAIDTNILLRRILCDDVLQAKKADKLFEKAEKILITDVVLVETVWTLKSKRYGASKEVIAETVLSLLEEINVVFESQQAVWSALNDYGNAKPVKTTNGLKEADFADALMINKSKVMMEQWGEPYDGTYTFDQAAQVIDGAKAL